MKKVLILGCGFSGLSALDYLLRFRRSLNLEILAVDKSKYFSFMPMLPDCLGRGIEPEFLTFATENFAKIRDFRFFNTRVNTINLSKQELVLSDKILQYDYLLIASGTETNFYGNDLLQQSAYKLDDVDDAKRLKRALEDGSFETYIVSGGGYTGVEIATNLSLYLKKRSLDKRVVIIERASSILGPLPEWMKDYVGRNLRALKIEVLTDNSIKEVLGQEILLASGIKFTKAMLIWSAGVRTADYIRGLEVAKNPQGRIEVDAYLRLNQTCFVAGDASLFKDQGTPLRMSVQFAITQGRHAASNIIASLVGKPLRCYRPQDPGYIIPLANNRACGKILGKDVQGALAVILHYFMCIYRTRGLRNKLGIIKNLILGGG